MHLPSLFSLLYLFLPRISGLFPRIAKKSAIKLHWANILYKYSGTDLGVTAITSDRRDKLFYKIIFLSFPFIIFCSSFFFPPSYPLLFPSYFLLLTFFQQCCRETLQPLRILLVNSVYGLDYNQVGSNPGPFHSFPSQKVSLKKQCHKFLIPCFFL